METNGRVTWRWMAITAVGIVTIGVTSWGGYMMGRDADLQRNLDRTRDVQVMVLSRLSGMESQLVGIQTQVNTNGLLLQQALQSGLDNAKRRR